MPQARDITGVPLWLLRQYLKEAGGTIRDDGSVAGDGWSAHLAEIEDHQVGSLRVGQVRLELDGETDALERLNAILERKLLRGGG